MGKASIQGAERTIGKVFSEDYVFSIPSYQRPYAWTTEQAGELLDDLLMFVESSDQPEEATPYFLGSIVLIKGDEPNAKVVDGQQRLTTITILLATLRALVPSDYKDELTSYLYEKGSIIALKPTQYRLTLRQRDSEFFQSYIQAPEGFEKIIALDITGLSDSQKNIRENARLFLGRLKKQPDETLDEATNRQILLAQFIVNQCYLVVVSTSDDDSAYRIFSVLNDRGLDLSYTDILKAEVIGQIPTIQEDIYNTKWEEIEESLGRETFQNLFAYIRTIYRKVKAQDTILKEFRLYVRPTKNPQQFINYVLKPYADAFFTIKKACYESIKGAEQVNNLLKWLNQIDNSDWIPPAIFYLSKQHDNPALLLRFFSELERLAAGMMFLRANVNKRIERYGRLLTAIENGDDLFVPNSPLQLTSEEQKVIIACLEGDLYHPWFCKYVLLRLDESLASGEASFNHPLISIEHVLPQNPKLDSTWVKWFPIQEEREKYVHRLGNLVLLSRKKNSEAQNYEFVMKKEKYFRTSTGICPFPLTTQVLLENEWTPLVIERRQQKLINKLRDIWRLN